MSILCVEYVRTLFFCTDFSAIQHNCLLVNAEKETKWLCILLMLSCEFITTRDVNREYSIITDKKEKKENAND